MTGFPKSALIWMAPLRLAGRAGPLIELKWHAGQWLIFDRRQLGHAAQPSKTRCCPAKEAPQGSHAVFA
ncbi:hypothetical protein Q3C01_37575 [Bradyrhizobium sp. UFLA05-109]